PEQRFTDVQMLTEEERNHLLIDWNETHRSYPADQCLHELFEAQVERAPEALAVVCDEAQLSYRELNHRANQLAFCLRSRGVGPEEIVGLCLERSLDMVVGFLGILKAGA